jgi:hypothetical protein
MESLSTSTSLLRHWVKLVAVAGMVALFTGTASALVMSPNPPVDTPSSVNATVN